MDKEILVYPYAKGKELKKGEYVKSTPKKWSEEEVNWAYNKKQEGYSYKEIGAALDRTEVSVSIKIKRHTKKNNTYNKDHVEGKYEDNELFINTLDSVSSLLDVYCGVHSYWKNKHTEIDVITNDKDKDIVADYHIDSLKLLCQEYIKGSKYDVIDLDPYGSAYESFDLAIKMAKKGLIITYGEMGHKRWKRLDYVSKRYDIDSIEDFTIEKLIEKTILIGKRNKKELTPVIITNNKLISRVYFKIGEYKESSQWKE